ncbi:phosphopantothenoylcysteine decarboxylase [Fontisphaera persica]|uniref:phosphopantothenoylcysteine decarboxylase domain-containing protein n=1 Tax=Fontisphaera persica TaxID=2974023 RepID=UPI0024C06474|nr:phosphopantothenoylcysteine decarboxylase [Fontisphaera persica]WCJ57929.1 phosphopantothenoylcysteine decarboxylase [Fontisphaera persica]
MQCLVTAGPTYEPLDEVRRLTNFSTGALGCRLAAALRQAGHAVCLLLSEQATAAPPAGWTGNIRRFSTTQSLHDQLAALAGPSIQAVFHAAAVSDFTFGRIYRQLAAGQLQEIHGAKIESRGAPLLAELTPTPKLLPRMAGWFPRALIVGWKYELEGTPDDALAKARRQLEEARTHACVLNGRAYGPGFALVTPGHPPRHCDDQPALFAALLRLLGEHPPR